MYRTLSPLRERFVTGASYRLTIIIEQSRLTKRGRGRYSKDGGYVRLKSELLCRGRSCELVARPPVHRSTQSNRKTFVLHGSPFPAPRFVKPARNRFESWLIRFRLRPGSFRTGRSLIRKVKFSFPPLKISIGVFQ